MQFYTIILTLVSLVALSIAAPTVEVQERGYGSSSQTETGTANTCNSDIGGTTQCCSSTQSTPISSLLSNLPGLLDAILQLQDLSLLSTSLPIALNCIPIVGANLCTAMTSVTCCINTPTTGTVSSKALISILGNANFNLCSPIGIL